MTKIQQSYAIQALCALAAVATGFAAYNSLTHPAATALLTTIGWINAVFCILNVALFFFQFLLRDGLRRQGYY